MSNYHRLYIPGAMYFFTIVTYHRKPIFSSKQTISLLKQAFYFAKQKLPFNITAIVILPDHLHCIWSLPKGDSDFSKRWYYIKTHFSLHYRKMEHHNSNRKIPVWQRRFWEHVIRNEQDLQRHLDYIHYNPVYTVSN